MIDQLAAHFLDCYARGAEPDGGWMHAKALQQSRLDATPEGAVRLDHLLAQIRSRTKPVRETFLADPRGLNFCALVAFHTMAVFEQTTPGVRVRWLDHATAAAEIGKSAPPLRTATRYVAFVEGVNLAMLPLAWIEDALFGAAAPTPFEAYLAQMRAMLAQAVPPAWGIALRGAGSLLAHAMYMIDGGGPFQTTLLEPGPGGGLSGGVLVMLQDDARTDALTQGQRHLAQPRRGLPYSALAYDATISSLAFGRSDAIVVELRCHGEPAFSAKLIVPYRPRTDEAPLLVRPARLEIESTASDSVGWQVRQFWDGVGDYKWPGGGRFEDRCETAPGAAPPAPAAPREFQLRSADGTVLGRFDVPTYLDGQELRVDDAVLIDEACRPAVVRDFVHSDDTGFGIDLEDSLGQRRLASPEMVRRFALVRRDSVDFVAEGRALLRDLAERGPRAPNGFGREHAQFALGALLREGAEGKARIAEVVELWTRSADAGHAMSQRALGLLHRLGAGVPVNLSQALKYFKLGAAQDEPCALSALGEMCETGEGLRADLAEAVRLYTRAAERGDAIGCLHLGRLCFEGRGVAQDAARGVALYTKAAELGSPTAQQRLAACHEEGLGTPRDLARAVHWYERAAAQGDAISINNLADKYEHGLGVKQDLAKAVELYERAARLKVIAAWYSLGNLYRQGRGVARDLAKALHYMEQAARFDFMDAVKRRADIQRDLAWEKSR